MYETYIAFKASTLTPGVFLNISNNATLFQILQSVSKVARMIGASLSDLTYNIM